MKALFPPFAFSDDNLGRNKNENKSTHSHPQFIRINMGHWSSQTFIGRTHILLLTCRHVQLHIVSLARSVTEDFETTSQTHKAFSLALSTVPQVSWADCPRHSIPGRWRSDSLQSQCREPLGNYIGLAWHTWDLGRMMPRVCPCLPEVKKTIGTASVSGAAWWGRG